MTFIRARQRAVTAVLPHNANRKVLVPKRVLVPSVPKGVTVQLGTGWVAKSAQAYVFSAPPGGNLDALAFDGLKIGSQYRIIFAASASAAFGSMVFRPGELGSDLTINADGVFEHTFTAANTDGVARFMNLDVTGVDTIGITIGKFTEVL